MREGEPLVTQGGKQRVTCLGKWRLGRVSKSPPQTYRKGRKLATAENCQKVCLKVVQRAQALWFSHIITHAGMGSLEMLLLSHPCSSK